MVVVASLVCKRSREDLGSNPPRHLLVQLLPVHTRIVAVVVVGDDNACTTTSGLEWSNISIESSSVSMDNGR